MQGTKLSTPVTLFEMLEAEDESFQETSHEAYLEIDLSAAEFRLPDACDSVRNHGTIPFDKVTKIEVSTGVTCQVRMDHSLTGGPDFPKTWLTIDHEHGFVYMWLDFAGHRAVKAVIEAIPVIADRFRDWA
ncbi:MAG: hypothetical protein OXG35_33880 [Acidobacteria bacterium]|nr:hypothetical protein [Acidobacteriota bacterium]